MLHMVAEKICAVNLLLPGVGFALQGEGMACGLCMQKVLGGACADFWDSKCWGRGLRWGLGSLCLGNL